jgi:AAA+ ATPase superfamily predicted ATPase/Holliday junction resolvase
VFRTNIPVTRARFHNRVQAIDRLKRVTSDLKRGEPRWLAIIGPRKVGKSSLLAEAALRFGGAKLRFVSFDVFEAMPVSLEVFRRLAARILDMALVGDSGAALSVVVGNPARVREILAQSDRFAKLPAALRATWIELADRPADDALLRDTLALPEQLARALDLRFVIAIDEFQELLALGGARGAVDPVPLMRSVWQRHERVGYVISGSSRTMLLELVTSERSPFFQHFDVLNLGPFDRGDAIELLTSEAEDRAISPSLAERAFDVLGGNPFYLQLFGEALTALEPPYDDSAFKEALQALLFSRTGRLALYFEAEHQRIVGRSAGLAAALEALASGPMRSSEVGARVRATSSGTTVRSLERLGDVVSKLSDGRYAIDDRAYAAWIRWRSPGGAVVPMTLVGNEAEQRVAQHLASLGFDLVYQSRASRGAFDLFALRGSRQLGVQVRHRQKLPLRFPKTAWARMVGDAKRWGWAFCIASVNAQGEVALLDPSRALKRKEVRIGQEARIDNLLTWLEQQA